MHSYILTLLQLIDGPASKSSPLPWWLMPAVVFAAIIIVALTIIWNRYKKDRNIAESLQLGFLKIRLAKTNAKDQEKEIVRDFKEAVSVMEQVLTGFTSIKKGAVSLELAAQQDGVTFFIVAPRKQLENIEKLVTASYNEAYIEPTEDYSLFQPDTSQAACLLELEEGFELPLKTYKSQESDPLNNLVNALSKLKGQDSGAVQIILKPANKSWAKQVKEKARARFKGEGTGKTPLRMLITGAGDKKDKDEPKRLTPAEEEQVKTIEEKASHPGFNVTIRLITSATTAEHAQSSLANLVNAFNQYGNSNGNRLKEHAQKTRQACNDFLLRFHANPKHQCILNTEELATIFHLPNSRFNPSSSIAWQAFKIVPPPTNIPQEGINLGYNIYRGVRTEIHIKDNDRFRHFYLIGQTGTGKSTMFKNMIAQDLKAGKGICAIDPHGEFADHILSLVPKERADDVIYFDPSDTKRPLGLNLLEANTPEEMDLVAMNAMNIMIRLFGDEIFGPRIQDYFRNGCLTLMADKEEGGALTDIVRLFTDDAFQHYKVSKVTNPIVRNFWDKQMAATGEREKQEMIPYFAAKFGAFTTNTLMRNIIGQTKSAFDFSEIMNSGKILAVNLSKGKIGDINSSLLGMIIVTKLQVAAMARSGRGPETLRPFHIYIDEFQNMVTESIESILSEARKYKLALHITHQFLGQLDKLEVVRKAIFGNVGTIMSYKIGAADAEFMAREFAPAFSEQDLINIDRFKAVVKLSIDTQPSPPFSLCAPPEVRGDKRIGKAIKQLSRLKYGRDVRFVEKEILKRMGTI